MVVQLTLAECCDVQKRRFYDPNTVRLYVQDTPEVEPVQKRVNGLSQHVIVQAALLLESAKRAGMGQHVERLLPTLEQLAILDENELIGISSRLHAAKLVIGPFVLPMISKHQQKTQNWIAHNITEVYDMASEVVPEERLDFTNITSLGLMRVLNNEIRSAVHSKHLSRLRSTREYVQRTHPFGGTKDDPVVLEG